MKIWSLFGLGCLMLIGFKSSGQGTELKGIEYLTPDTVKAKIMEVIIADKSGNPFFVTWDTYRDTTYLMLARYSTSDSNFFELIKNSNRFMTISEKQTIPIVIGSDLAFSTLFHRVKNKGKKNEIISQTTFGISGYIINFTGTYPHAKLVKFEYFTY